MKRKVKYYLLLWGIGVAYDKRIREHKNQNTHLFHC